MLKGLLGWNSWVYQWGFQQPVGQILHTITFNVIPIDSVVVLDGVTGTNIGGQVIFQKPTGNYAYSVSKTGYIPQTGTINITTSDIVEDISLATFNIKYGYLYNWYAASDVRNIANTGSHVPSSDDWSTLLGYLGTYDSLNDRWSDVAIKLCETGIVYWQDPNSATNSAKFNARGVGYRSDGFFVADVTYMEGALSPFMTSTAIDATTINRIAVSMNQPTYVYRNLAFKKDGLPIRLIKDSTTLTDGQSGIYIGNDGTIYRTICIGTQEWLADNLAETKYKNGDTIPNVTVKATWNALTTGALCAYNNDVNNVFFNPTVELAEVTTIVASNITTIASTSGGSIAGFSIGTITEKGICWGTSANPTKSDNYIIAGSGINSFASNLTGLTNNTTYHIRAYAINEAGISYGNDISFTTFTIYYVAASGGSDAANGYIGTPWATLDHAITTVTRAGDKIYLNAGSHSASQQMNLAVGVLIDGAGVGTTTLTLTYVSDDLRYAPIQLKSATQGTLGNQSISNITFDGNNITTIKAICIFARSNIEVHHCTFQNFKRTGLAMIGTDDGNTPVGDVNNIGTPPTTYATGNSIHDCNFINCAGRYTYSTGAIDFSGQDGLSLYNNTITLLSSDRTVTAIGFGMKCYEFYKNCNIYNNNIHRTAGATVNISMELWDAEGGNIVYGNTIDGGCIDVGGHHALKGESTYSIYIHDNIVENTGSNIGAVNCTGITVEGGAQDVYVYKNKIKNYYISIGCTTNQVNLTWQNNYFYYNQIINPGLNTADAGQAFIFGGIGTGCVMTNCFIYNNVIYTDNAATYKPYYAFYWLMAHGAFSNFYIRNNSIVGFITKGYSRASNDNSAGTPDFTFDYIYIENNITYGNGNSNDPWFAGTNVPVHRTNTNNAKSDPLWIDQPNMDFHLQAGSPCINNGQDVGLTNDYDGVAVANPPEIGIYEL